MEITRYLEYNGLRRHLDIEDFETKSRFVRLMKRMKWVTQAVSIVILAGMLALSALACPLWVGSRSHCDMPCPNQTKAPEHCPTTICQVSAPYLTSDIGADVPPLNVLAQAVGVSTTLSIALTRVLTVLREDGAPPGLSGPLFLRTHSLLI